MERPENIIVKAPAKINFRLKITGQRSDGYHELVTIMVPVSLYDYIELEFTDGNGINIQCEGFESPDNKNNLAYKAAKAFFDNTGINAGLLIKLKKNIPVAAGLGGGSSDAAAILSSLNRVYNYPVSFHELSEIAVTLGADVPFFLYNKPCIARGIGEILEPVEDWPALWYVIVNPPISVSTAWVYSQLKYDLTKKEDTFILSRLKKVCHNICELLENDLEMVTATRYPVINVIKSSLIEAKALGALMSGSGPSVFGVFNSEKDAREAEEKIVHSNLGFTFIVKSIK